MPPLTRRSRKDDVKALASNMYSNGAGDNEFKARDAIVWYLGKLWKIWKSYDTCFIKTFYGKFEIPLQVS